MCSASASRIAVSVGGCVHAPESVIRCFIASTVGSLSSAHWMTPGPSFARWPAVSAKPGLRLALTIWAIVPTLHPVLLAISR